jgi:acetyl-CoA carboxylase carboxyltransferase component
VPLGISSDQLIPKAYPGENENMLYGGALDGHSSIKLAHHLRTVNRFGLNYLGISGFLGFLARLGDHLGTEESLGKNVHVEGRVIPGGAEILDELRQFEQAALLLVPHQGLLYGGAWAVIDRNVNPNIVKVADFTSQLGILGSVASNELPLATDHQKTPEDKKKTRIMFDLQNTPQRALKVGSIHHVIEDVGRTPAILYGLLEQKTAEIRQAREAKKKEEILIRQVTGGLDLMGVGYALLPGGKIRIDFPEGTITTGLESAKKGITAHFQSRPANPMGMLLAKPEEEK